MIFHLDLSVSDVDAGAEWYERVLWLRRLTRSELPGRTMVVLLAADAGLIIGLDTHTGTSPT